MRKGIRILNRFLALGFLAVLTYKSVRVVRLENFQDMGIFPLPQGTVRLAATVGGILMILAILARLLVARRFRSTQSGEHDNSTT